MKRVAHAASVHAARRRVVETVCTTLLAVETELDALDALDAKVGDGDTGSTFATAARALLAELDGLSFGARGARERGVPATSPTTRYAAFLTPAPWSWQRSSSRSLLCPEGLLR